MKDYLPSDNYLSNDQEHNLCLVLVQAAELVYKARVKELNQYGITPRQAAVLNIVTFLGGDAKPTVIAKWLLREPHTISSILTTMERKGLIRKVRNPENRSEVEVMLTEKGIQANSCSLKREISREIVSCLSEKERQQLSSYLKKLRSKAFQCLNTELTRPSSDTSS